MHDRLASELDGMTAAAGGADPADDGQHDVLGRHPRAYPAVDPDQHVRGLFLYHALGRQHMLHLGGADAVSQRAQCAVGRGMGIAAHHGHARQGGALLRPDHVHNALARVIDLEFGDAEGVAVAVQGLHLQLSHRIGDAGDTTAAVGGGHVVVRRGQIGRAPPWAAPGLAQALEGLGRGHLVDQMPVYINEATAVPVLAHHVGIPQFVVQGLGAHRCSPHSTTRMTLS